MNESLRQRPAWAIILHGGAHEVPAPHQDAARRGVRAALEAGRAVLEQCGPATEAVQAAVQVLENWPVFNAGYGSAQTEDGTVETQASVMDGDTLEVGAVAALQGARHPVRVAGTLLRQEPILLVGEGADRFARESGAHLCRPEDLIAPDQAKVAGASDTVGCVALDVRGHLATAVSTGGLDGQRAGRVGDSPQPGCGYYADDTLGAVALTGDGEQIARMMSAARVLHRLPVVAPEDALASVLSEMKVRVGGEAGGVLLTPDGRPGWWHNSRHMPVALQVAGQAEPQVALSLQASP